MPGCSSDTDQKVTDPCDPAYTGDEICLDDLGDTGVDEDGDVGDGDEQDSGSCECTEESVCCDGCDFTGEGEVCDDDDLACTEHRCSATGTCELAVLEGWCLVEGVCHNMSSDPFHCGACDNICGRTEVCFEGECIEECAEGYTDCDGSCFDLNSDPLNCGSCGEACSTGEECIEGECILTCLTGLTDCDGVCANLDSDPFHCGECDNECIRGQVCANGECVADCLEEQEDCDGACVYLESDPLHCGECGNECRPDQECLDGACGLPCDTGYTDCGEVCADLLDDSNHCGECDNPCDGDETCVNGECVVLVTGVDTAPEEAFILVGKTVKLTATVNPPNATDPSFGWTSSDTEVATVDPVGLVTGVSVGTATITATTIDGGHTGFTQVTVTSMPMGYKAIEAGVFHMGSQESETGRNWFNESYREVTITRPFIMKSTQVTQEEWETLMGDNPSYDKACGTLCPVEQVSWHMALTYANSLSVEADLPECFDCTGSGAEAVCDLKARYVMPQDCPGYRLPTEAEWEYAARAGTTSAFHTGNITGEVTCTRLDRAGWYKGNSSNTAHAVGGKDANDWGLYDMHGNVWEWAWDLYDMELGSEPAVDPHGTSGAGLTHRSVRGGAYWDDAKNCRAASRDGFNPTTDDSSGIGLRLVRSL